MTLQTDASLRLAHRVGFKQRLRGFYGRVFVWALMGAVLISLASLATLLIVIFTLLDGQRGVIAGSLTLMLLVLPIVIITAQEAIKAVPDSHRYAAFAMGATRWQVAKTVVLPQAAGGIASGAILAYSRAIGEAAPIVVISSIITITFIPANLTDSFTVLPLTIFNWVKRPDPAFQDIASTAIIVLLALLLIMNSIAIWIRARSTRARGALSQ